MIVKYIGRPIVALENGKLYEVLDQKHGFYKIMSEHDETYYFPAEAFEIVESVERPAKNGVSFNYMEELKALE